MRRLNNLPFAIGMRIVARIVLIILVFTAMFLVYLHLRDYAFPASEPFAWEHLIRFEIHEFEIGLFLRLILVPLLLMYPLAYIPYYRRKIQDQAVPNSTFGLFAGLAAVQLISQAYDLWAFPEVADPMHQGFLIVLIGCLLGGWRVGIPLGVISMLFQSISEMLGLPIIMTDLHNLGLWQFLRGLDWGPFLYTRFATPHFSAGIWVAVLGCMGAALLGRFRYSPYAAGIMGMILVFAAGYWHIAAGAPPVMLALPAQALIAGMAAAWVMLMIRNLQVLDAQRKAAAAELARTQAELRALRAQINPHFFFNALNTIRYMVRTDPATARDLLIDLSEVFQRTLRSGDFVPLREELRCVEAYLSLEQARLGDRLRIVWGGQLQPDTPLDSETPLLDQPVPTLALQPIVENAVIHGIGKKIGGGVLSINVDRLKSDLIIIVADDGTGMDSDRLADLLNTDKDNHASIGLRNVDGRLRMLYGPEYRLAIESAPDKGTRATIRIPIAKKEAKP